MRRTPLALLCVIALAAPGALAAPARLATRPLVGDAAPPAAGAATKATAPSATPAATPTPDPTPAASAEPVAVEATPPPAIEVAPPDIPAAPTEERLVAVLDLKAEENARSKANALGTILTAEVSATTGYKAVSKNELASIIAHQANAQLTGCEDPRCMASIAHLANADMVISGNVEVLEGATVVGFTLVDVSDVENGPQVAARQKVSWRGSDDELLLVVRPMVQRLLDARNAHTHVGHAELFVPEGAEIIVDDKSLGTAPMQAIRDLPTGVHSVKILKDGYSPEQIDLVVARNETTIVRADLEAIPLTDQPWFWAAAGGVVLLAGGTATGIGIYALSNQQPPPARVVLGKPTE